MPHDQKLARARQALLDVNGGSIDPRWMMLAAYMADQVQLPADQGSLAELTAALTVLSDVGLREVPLSDYIRWRHLCRVVSSFWRDALNSAIEENDGE